MSQLQDKQYTDKKALWPFLRRIFSYSIYHKRWFWSFCVAVIAVGISDAIFPLIWMYFLDGVVVPNASNYLASLSGGTPSPLVGTDGLLLYAFIFGTNALLQIIGVYYFIRYAGLLQEHVMYRLRQQMFERLQSLSFSYYDKSASGWLLSRISSDTERVTELISWGFLEIIWGMTMIIACLSVMFYYNWQLALIITLAIPLLIIVSFKIRLLILRYSRKSRKINSELTANYSEHINGIAVNKITAQEARVSEAFKGLSDKMRQSSYRASYYTAMYMPLVIFIGSLSAALVLYFGAQMAVAIPVGITLGTLAAFFSYATQIFLPILDIARFYALAQGSLSAGERIFSLIDEQPMISDSSDAKSFGKLSGKIDFEDVSFSYVPDQPILSNFNLSIQAGQSIALVGATGHGKSTIANLICRFYEPTGGQLKIDGIDYRSCTQHSLRSQLGVVLQTPHLFSGTIRSNIQYGNLLASDDLIKEALTLVGAIDFVDRLSEEVGENGDKLSMGEKQLLSFARALLRKPRLLIMDEATSSIDTLTEAKIQSGISQMIKGRTSIIIAHRLSTIKHCDRILVISNGKIIEDGNHANLIRKGGHYHDLYTKQLSSIVKAL